MLWLNDTEHPTAVVAKYILQQSSKSA